MQNPISLQQHCSRHLEEGVNPLQRNHSIDLFVVFCAAHYNMHIMITNIAGVDNVIVDDIS